MKHTLVDTDILIDFLRGKKKAKDYLAMLLEESSICCSAITVAEIASGIPCASGSSSPVLST